MGLNIVRDLEEVAVKAVDISLLSRKDYDVCPWEE